MSFTFHLLQLYLPLSCVLLVAVQTLAHNLQSEFGPSTKNTLLDDVDVADEGTDDSNRIRRSGLTGLINKKLHFIGKFFFTNILSSFLC